MNNKMDKILEEFLGGVEFKDENELNEKLQEFMIKYNSNEINYTNNSLDDAYNLLEKAENTKNKKEALKLAKRAYDMCPECLEALLFQLDLEDDSIKRENLLNDGLEYEKNRLKKEGYFKKEYIGHFYGLIGTRQYIRGLESKVQFLIEDGKIKQARDVCLEILRLNENDNTGSRYILMAIYAYLEEEKEMLKLYKKYPEEDLEMLFPQFAIYYKLGKYDDAKEVLKRINKANPHFIKYFKGTIKNNDMPGYYRIGDASEVLMYFDEFQFLILSLSNISDFVLAYSKDK